MNGRRLFDRFVLADARIVSCHFDLINPNVTTPTKANVTVAAVPQNFVAETPPEGAKQAIQTVIDVHLNVASADNAEDRFYSLQLKVTGTFVMAEGDVATLEEIASEGHCFARMIFPLARSEIVRVLARAKVPDLPLAWDIGPGAVASSERNVSPS